MRWNLRNLNGNFPNLLKLRGGKTTPLSDATAQTDTHGDQYSTPIAKSMELSNTVPYNKPHFVTTITRLPLLDFMECCVQGKYDSIILGIHSKPTEDEISEAWLKLLSQYYAARKDDSNSTRNEILCRMQELRLRASIITMLLNSLGMVYSPKLIKTLKDYDEAFEQFAFTESTINDDLQLVKNMEINYEIEYRQLKDDLEAIERNTRDKSGNQVVTGEQVFYDYVAAYNEAFKTGLSVDTMSTMTYANNCHRYDEYVKSMDNGGLSKEE